MTFLKIVAVITALFMHCTVAGEFALAQSGDSCTINFTYCAGDTWPIPPGTRCFTPGVPYVCVPCWIPSNKCKAICWDCVFGGATASHPINLATGDTFITQSDITIPGLGGGLTLSRTWHSRFPFGESPATSGMFGGNWRSTYEESLFVDSQGMVKYVRGTGAIWTLGVASLGNPDYYGMVAPVNGDATLTYDGNLWTLTFKSGEKRVFQVNRGSYGTTGTLLSMSDRNGNTTQLAYDTLNRLTTVTDAASRHLYFTYASPTSSLVVGVSSDVGISLSYGYDDQGRLASVTKPDSTTVSFQYDANSMITAVLDTNGKVLESHTYDAARRGVTSSRAGGVDAVTITYPFLLE